MLYFPYIIKREVNMRVAKALIGLISVSVGVVFLLAIVLYYAYDIGASPGTGTLSTASAAIASAALALPLLFLAAFVRRQGLSPWIWPAVLFLLASYAIGAGATSVLKAGIDLKALATADAIGLKRLVASILGSKGSRLVAYFARAFAWILVGVALRPVAGAAPSVKPFRTLCALSGLSLASVVGSPMFAIFMPLSYLALGWFLIVNRLGARDDRGLRYIDDYRPA